MRLHPLTGAQILAPLEFFGEGAAHRPAPSRAPRRQRLSRRAARPTPFPWARVSWRWPTSTTRSRPTAPYRRRLSHRPGDGAAASARRDARSTASWSSSSPIPIPMDLLTAPFDVERRRRFAPVVGALCLAGSLMLGGVVGGQCAGASGRPRPRARPSPSRAWPSTAASSPGPHHRPGRPPGRRHHRPADGGGALRSLSPRSSRALGESGLPPRAAPLLVHECRGHSTLRRIGFLAPVRPASLLVGLGGRRLSRRASPRHVVAHLRLRDQRGERRRRTHHPSPTTSAPMPCPRSGCSGARSSRTGGVIGASGARSRSPRHSPSSAICSTPRCRSRRRRGPARSSTWPLSRSARRCCEPGAAASCRAISPRSPSSPPIGPSSCGSRRARPAARGHGGNGHGKAGRRYRRSAISTWSPWPGRRCTGAPGRAGLLGTHGRAFPGAARVARHRARRD